MNRKRIISLLIALVMILCMLPLGSVFAYADDPCTVTAIPNNAEYGSVSGGGTYASGASVSLTATAKPGYTFVNWTEEGAEPVTSNPYTFTASSGRTLTANFEAETPVTTSYSISTSSNNAEYGSASGGGTYASGASVSLTATAKPGYTFVNWTEEGAEPVTNNPYEFTASGDRALTANFEAETPVTTSYSIGASSNNAEYGSVSGGGTYASGASVSLTATAKPGYTFVNWTEEGAEPVTNNPYEFTANGDRALTANFEAETPVTTSYSISVSTNNAEYGSVSGGGTYASGASVSLTATAKSGYTFVNWTENGGEVATSNPYEFTAGGARTLIANFAAETRNVDQTKVADGVAVKSGEVGSEEGTKGEGGTEDTSGTGGAGESDASIPPREVTVNKPAHGTVTANKTSAKAGETVELTITADTGYEFTGLEVKKPDGSTVPVTENSFTMPDCNVKVSATFEAIIYSITGGANGGWIKGTLLPYSITAKRSPTDDCTDRFTGVVIDTSILPITDYIVSYGSVTVTIMPYALQRLSTGVHTVTFWFKDGYVTTFLYIWADPRYPATGDERQTTMWAALSGATLVGMGAILILGRMYGKKKKKNKD